MTTETLTLACNICTTITFLMAILCALLVIICVTTKTYTKLKSLVIFTSGGLGIVAAILGIILNVLINLNN